MAGWKDDWPHRAFVWFERTVLSAGMTVLAIGVERILVRAIKKGGVQPAPRTAAGPDEALPVAPAERPEAELGTTRPTL